MARWPSVWCSKYIFSYFLIDFRALQTIYFHFCNFIKELRNELNGSLQRILQDFMKKIILGTSDAWSTSCLSHRPREPGYYIVDCRISATYSSIPALYYIHILNSQHPPFLFFPFSYSSCFLLVLLIIVQQHMTDTQTFTVILVCTHM